MKVIAGMNEKLGIIQKLERFSERQENRLDQWKQDWEEKQKRRDEEWEETKAGFQTLPALRDVILCLKQLATSRISAERLANYKRGLQGADSLIDKRGFIKDHYARLQLAMERAYGDGIGHRRIARFFKRVLPENILIVKEKAYDDAIQQLTHKEVKEKTPEGARLEAVYHPLSGLVILKEQTGDTIIQEKKYQMAISEELMHFFLEFSSKSRIPFKESLRILKEQREAEPGSLKDYYLSAREQVVKAMVVGCFEAMEEGLSEKMLDKDYLKSARMGRERIERVGWKRILKGDFGK